jgi:hypothetical protein
VDVVLVVRMGVVLAMVGDPANGPALRGTATERGQEVFEPFGPGGKAPVGQQPVISHADAQPAGQPVTDEADEEGLPGEEGGEEGQEGPDVKPGNPE